MAIALDANLGVNDFLTGSSRTLTTTSAAAALSRVILFASYFAVTPISATTFGGAAATLDKRTLNGSDVFDIWSLYMVSGLASGSSITVTGGAGGGLLMGAASFTGLDVGGADTSSSATGTGASWSSGSATSSVSDSLYVGGSGSENATSHTNVAVSGIELHDRYRAADGQGFATGYKILTASASDAITGTFSNAGSTSNTGALVVYKTLAASTAAPDGIYRYGRIRSPRF